jgi:hypothetical protein
MKLIAPTLPRCARSAAPHGGCFALGLPGGKTDFLL